MVRRIARANELHDLTNYRDVWYKISSDNFTKSAHGNETWYNEQRGQEPDAEIRGSCGGVFNQGGCGNNTSGNVYDSTAGKNHYRFRCIPCAHKEGANPLDRSKMYFENKHVDGQPTE